MPKNLTFIPYACRACGKPIELPRPCGRVVHPECKKRQKALLAKRHYEKRRKEYESEKYQARKLAGVCILCDSPPVKDKTLCEAHLESTREKRRKYLNKDLRIAILQRVKARAKFRNIPFNLELEDIIIPEICPVLGITLKKTVGQGKQTNDTPSLDRIVPELGYVKGNVIVVSWLANNIKGNFNADDIIKVGLWMKGIKNGLQ